MLIITDIDNSADNEDQLSKFKESICCPIWSKVMNELDMRQERAIKCLEQDDYAHLIGSPSKQIFLLKPKCPDEIFSESKINNSNSDNNRKTRNKSNKMTFNQVNNHNDNDNIIDDNNRISLSNETNELVDQFCENKIKYQNVRALELSCQKEVALRSTNIKKVNNKASNKKQQQQEELKRDKQTSNIIR